jgi:hypothetical protein
MQTTREESRSVMAPTSSREEQRLVEELWDASRQAYGEPRRREICVEWIQHHERLAVVYRSATACHEAEQERYEALLKDLYTTTT